MKFSKHTLVASSLAFVFGVNLCADEVYTIQNKTLKEALEIISKKSNLSYIANDEILERKYINNIENIEGTQQALDKILEGTGLKAVIQNEAIVIVKEKVEGKGTVLEAISVNDSYKNGTAENGYLSEDITGVGLWGKRSLQDTPYSMTVIPKDLIENTVAADMSQIYKMNPVTQETGRFSQSGIDLQKVSMRGFDSSLPIINGIPSAALYSTPPMMFDIERVEIISGATGFLYGGGRVGGAVNYITKKPTIDTLTNLNIGNYGGNQNFVNIDTSGQIDDKNTFGYRASLFYLDGKSASEIDIEQKAGSLMFDWKPTDNFYTDIKYTRNERTSNGGFTTFNNIDDRSIIKKNKSYNPDLVEEKYESDKFENNIKWNINDTFTLRTNFMYENVLSYVNNILMNVEDGKLKAYNLATYSGTSYSKYGYRETDNYGANIFLDSNFDTFGVNHNLTIGTSFNSYKFSVSDDDWIGYGLTNDIALNDFKNVTRSDFYQLPWGTGTIGTTSRKPWEKKQYKNILIGDDIVFNEQWSALVGVNYATVINKSYSNNTENDKSELTPTLSLIFKPFENLTTYATYIESLEAGETVGSVYQNEGDFLDPYKSKQYEVGVKHSLTENILLTGALFRIEKANSYINNATTPKPTLTQDGEAIHQGLELTVTGKVTDNLTLVAGGTLMDLSIEKHSNKALEGNKPTNVASKMAKIYAEYEIPQIKGLSINGGAYYTSEKYADDANTDIMPSYTVYDSGFRYKTKINKFPTTFNLNVRNLTDEVYWTHSSMLGDPRSVAMSMKMEF
ncbi:TonB-dependent siderophore receptor [Aliarcobacter butzleri]|uniref:TonB-dependent siderophore receptor n=1 Tax=Aliarcobacter butzleri TaxID=28197 RepID=UPI0024DEA9E5|nr:TonB-dependent receptor [Aliarcobacter butzleri]MDK2090411.1 TonB-dependent receptor [Aliarcobacter butzleri]